PRAREGNLPRPDRRHGQARQRRRQNRRGQDGQVLRRGLPARTALHQRTNPVHQRPHRNQGRQVRREHHHPPLRKIQSRRPHLDSSPNQSSRRNRRRRV